MIYYNEHPDFNRKQFLEEFPNAWIPREFDTSAESLVDLMKAVDNGYTVFYYPERFLNLQDAECFGTHIILHNLTAITHSPSLADGHTKQLIKYEPKRQLQFQFQ
jgi:hypothetical protein